MTDDIWKLSDDICNLIIDCEALNNRYSWEARCEGDEDLPTAGEVESIRARAENIKERGQLMRWLALACYKRYNTDRPHPKYDSWHRWAVAIISGPGEFLESAERQQYFCGSYLSWGYEAVEELVAELRAEVTVATVLWAQLSAETEAKTSGQQTKRLARNGIPSKWRTRTMTKREAAKYLRRGNADSAVEWLNSCIKDDTISCETLSRQSHVFDVRQFPEGVRDEILRT